LCLKHSLKLPKLYPLQNCRIKEWRHFGGPTPLTASRSAACGAFQTGVTFEVVASLIAPLFLFSRKKADEIRLFSTLKAAPKVAPLKNSRKTYRKKTFTVQVITSQKSGTKKQPMVPDFGTTKAVWQTVASICCGSKSGTA
jgi:hypothetical protein